MSTTHTILSSFFLSKLIPDTEEIIGDHQCGLQCTRLSTGHVFYIHQILEKKWEYNEVVNQLYIDLKKAYDSVRREVLYNILIEFGIALKLVWLIKTCLNETCGRVWVVTHLSYIILMQINI